MYITSFLSQLHLDLLSHGDFVRQEHHQFGVPLLYKQLQSWLNDYKKQILNRRTWSYTGIVGWPQPHLWNHKLIPKLLIVHQKIKNRVPLRCLHAAPTKSNTQHWPKLAHSDIWQNAFMKVHPTTDATNREGAMAQYCLFVGVCSFSSGAIYKHRQM